MLYFSILIFFNSVTFANCSELTNSSLQSINYIAKNYFVNKSVLFAYWDITSMDSREECLKILAKSEILALELCNVDYISKMQKLNKENRIGAIVVYPNKMLIDENRIKMLKNCESWNGKSKIIILLENQNEKIVGNLLKTFWRLTKAIDVTLMLITNATVKFYTLQPYKNLIIEELKIENLFPNKIFKNLNGSTIFATTAVFEPFVFAPNSKNVYDEGIEVRMIGEISKRLNFKLKYKKAPFGEDPWITLKINGKLTGNFGLLDRLEVDILFQGWNLQPDTFGVSEPITVHLFDRIIWVVPKKPYVFDWDNFFEIFQNDLWIALLVVVILTSIVVYFITKPGYALFTYPDAFFQVLSQMLSRSIMYHHNSFTYRIFMINFSFFTLIIIELYQSSLTRFLTTPESSEQYKSLEEAIDDGLIAKIYWSDHYNLSDHHVWNKILTPGKNKFVSNYSDVLREISVNKTAYTYSSDIYVRYIEKEYFAKEGKPLLLKKLKKMSETGFIPFYISKDHPLLRVFRYSIMRLVESGLVDYWTDEFLLGKNGGEIVGDNGPIPLTFLHLRGVFMVSSGGLILAFVVFVGELWYGARKRRRMSYLRDVLRNQVLLAKKKSM